MKSRIGMAVTGVIIMLFAGLVYAWSILAGPVAAYFDQWNKTQLSFTFTLCMMFFCLGGLVGGILIEKAGVRKILLASGVLFLLGFYLASQTKNLSMLYLGYGILAGFASGLAYNGVMSTVTKWFPERTGLISGVLLMGFGFGSFLIGKVYQGFTPSGAGLENWRHSFFILGVCLFVVMICSSMILRRPEKKNERQSTEAGMQKDAKPGQMLKTRSFWIFFIWATVMSAAGLAIVSQAAGIAAEVGPDKSLGTISTVVGLISIFNGIGRVIFGGWYDAHGRRKTMLVNAGVFIGAILVLLVALQTGSFLGLVFGFVLTGLAYGGVTPTNSAFVSDYYGSRYYAVNLPLVNLNLLIASFGGTLAGGLYDRSGSYLTTLYAMLIAVAVGIVCTFLIRGKNK